MLQLAVVVVVVLILISVGIIGVSPQRRAAA